MRKTILAVIAMAAFPVYSQTPQSFLDIETNRTSAAAVGANWAWSRGYTGKGATILIMDSGIDVNNREFAGRIKYSIDYTATGLQDKVGHGTHVAGIAAAANNGLGTQGIAYDANIAVAKITNTSSVSMQSAQRALVWAGQYSDIVVANLSANVNYSTAYLSAMRQVAPGMFVNTDRIYGGKNYYNLENPGSWKLPAEMVLTVSAGNSRAGFVQSPAVFATATDASGNLVLGGRMLVVGNWNTSLNVVEGAQAGHICKDFVNNTCQDRYRTSDFYILAPGSGIVSTGIGDTTRTMSGTSQAAPTVAGAVAVINQMWPYMKGEQIAQLLLKTANKNLPGYRVEVMGQGLLDLNRATQPIGNLGISTTGRTGPARPITGSISVANVGAVAGKLSSVTVVDEFQRDYRVDISSMATKNMWTQSAFLLDAAPGQSWSSRWTGVPVASNMGVYGQTLGNNSTVTIDTRHLNPTAQFSHQVTVTNTEVNPFIQFSGMWGTVQGATTFEYSTMYRPKPEGWYGQMGVMQTSTRYQPGMIERVDPIYSVHAMAGYQIQGWNLFGGIKPTVIHGNITMRLPGDVDSDGNLQYNTTKVSLAGARPVSYIGTGWQHQWRGGHGFAFRTMLAEDKSNMTRVNYTYRF